MAQYINVVTGEWGDCDDLVVIPSVGLLDEDMSEDEVMRVAAYDGVQWDELMRGRLDAP
jgi:hypothetical protein